MLTLTRASLSEPDSLWVLRAWHSGYQDGASATPILLASLVQEQALHPAGLLTLVHSGPAPAERVEGVLALLHPFATQEIRLSSDDLQGSYPILRAAQTQLGNLP
jgi:hypothetical protein